MKDFRALSAAYGICLNTMNHEIQYSRKVWQIDSLQAFGERKFGEL